MDPLPLIPSSTKNSNHDTSHIVRESFQEFLGRQLYPQNIGENLERNKVKMEEIKATAITANSILKKSESVTNDIGKVETRLMEHKGEYLVAKHLISKDNVLSEKIKLKRVELFRKLSKLTLEKYNLLEQPVLLPNALERSINFRINSNRHLCNPPCKSDLDVVPTKLSATNCKGPRAKAINYRTTRGLQSGEHKYERVFVANPECVIFYNYELNVTYKKTLKLRNVTNVKQIITLHVYPQSNYFTIELHSASKIAPGMCAVYIIRYRTSVYHDVRECIVFKTHTGLDLVVTILTQRNSPSLRTYIFKSNDLVSKTTSLNDMSRSSFNLDRAMALNSTIDCGYTLVGDEVKLSLIMKNEGGYGQFFVLTEDDWFSDDVKNVNTKMELFAGSFHLYPAYFEVKENEFVEVEMSFYPKKYGMYVETLYILCSNNTLEQLDIIGDGVLFNKDFVRFELIRKESRPFFLDHESEYCLHIGNCLTLSKVKGVISVSNNSPLNFKYRWNMRKSDNSKSPGFKHVPPDWVVLKKIQCLLSNSVTDFEVEIFPQTEVGGLYHCVLGLYVENVPEISLQDHQTFTVLEQKDYATTGFLDVFIGEVEILCEVEEPDVVLEPNPLIIPGKLKCNDEHRQLISVIPRTNFPMKCKWISSIHNRTVTIIPHEFELHQNNMSCIVNIYPTDYEDIEEKFLLCVNGGLIKRYFVVSAEIDVPTIFFSLAKIDFGDTMKHFTYCEELHIENNNSELLEWYVVEEVFDFSTCQFLKLEDTKQLTPNRGVLYGLQHCKLEYTANTEVCGKWLSYLKLYTNLSPNKPDFTCAVHYRTCIPEILIHTNTSELPILCPTDILYVGVTTTHSICLHNTGNIHIVYLFGQTVGESSNDFEIKISPKYGIINTQHSAQVDVMITPGRMGFFEDVYVPLFMLGNDDVILVQLMCIVGDLTVNIHIPNRMGNYVQVIWPKLFRDVCYEDVGTEYLPDYKNVNNDYDNIENITEPIPTPDQSLYEDHFEENQSNEEENEDNVTTLYIADTHQSSATESSKSRPESEKFSSMVETNVTETSSLCTETTDFTSETFPTRQKLREMFGHNLVLHEHVLEYPAVPLKTPVKRTIKVENLTPGSGTVYVEAINYFHTEPERNVVNDLLVKMKMLKSTEWEEMAGDHGIVVKIDKQNNYLSSWDTIEFDVWVFATTWGYYIDEIVLDIGELAPFCASLIIEIVGLPIEFPIAQNSICKIPTLRLGVLALSADIVARKLKVYNSSVVPVTITWYFFLNARLDGPDKAFSIIFDVDDSKTRASSIKGRLLLTKEYYGEFTSIFEVSPNILTMPPESTAYFDILTNVYRFEEAFTKKNIEGNLIGLIDLPEKSKFHSNLFCRPSGMDIGLARVRLTCKLEIASLDMNKIPDVIKMSVYANDIMEERTFIHRKRLVFKNSRRTPAIVFMEIVPPYEIVSVKTCNTATEKFDTVIAVNPNQCIEVIIQCILYREDILKIIQFAKNQHMTLGYTNAKNNAFVISKSLAIYQRGLLQKLVAFELTVYYPIFKVNPKTIEFGTVFVGNTAKTVITLKNFTAAPIPFEILKANKLNEVVIQPSHGIIPKVSEGADIILSVFFTPAIAKTYQEWIVIASNIPRHHIAISLIGVGSFSEEFYIAGRH